METMDMYVWVQAVGSQIRQKYRHEVRHPKTDGVSKMEIFGDTEYSISGFALIQLEAVTKIISISKCNAAKLRLQFAAPV